MRLVLGVDLNSLPKDEIGDLPSTFKPGHLRTLETGRGIAIGDAVSKVRKLMGAPTWQGKSKYTSDERVWTYHRRMGTKDDGMDYTALFRLRKNKVACIELSAAALPG